MLGKELHAFYFLSLKSLINFAVALITREDKQKRVIYYCDQSANKYCLSDKQLLEFHHSYPNV